MSKETHRNISDYRAQASPEELRANSAKGGVNRGKNIRKKKKLREYLDFILTEDLVDEMNMALIKKALDGDTKAYECIRDTLGEKASDKIEVSANDEINIVINGKDKS